jgi:hypothetical protein
MHPRPTQVLPTLILACAIFPAARAFQLTGPAAAEKLDLTKPITVSWDATEGSLSEPDARELNLWFYAIFSSGDRGGWEIASNLSLASSNSYEWDPSGIAKTIEDNNQTLSPDAVHSFEARLLDQDGGRLADVESEKYALAGYDFIRDSSSSGRDGVRAGAYGATVAAAAVGIAAAIL